MNHFKTLALGLFAASFSLSCASASSLVSDGASQEKAWPSIIYLGDPDPCANNACEPQQAAAEPLSDKNAALVDAFGMPTHMPIIMRPSMDDGTPSATAVPKAPATPAVPATADAKTPVTPAAPTPAKTVADSTAPVVPAPATDGIVVAPEAAEEPK